MSCKRKTVDMGLLPYLSSVAMFFLAIACIVAGAMMSLAAHGVLRRGDAARNASETRSPAVTLQAAVMMPVFASVALLGMFLLFAYSSTQLLLVLYFLTVCLSVTSFAARPLVFACLTSLGAAACQRGPRNSLANSTLCSSCCPCSVGDAVAALVGVACCLLWLLSGGWLVSNVLGIALGVSLIGIMRLPSLKVGAVALCGLLVYDVFWVFLSPLLFSRNVMVDVAQQAPANPAHEVAKALPLPADSLPPLNLDMPNKLQLPVFVWLGEGEVPDVPAGLHMAGFTMLGLGDIALPGLLLAMAYRADWALAPPRDAAQQHQEQGSAEETAGLLERGARAPNQPPASPTPHASGSDSDGDGDTAQHPPVYAGLAGWAAGCWEEVRGMSGRPLFRAGLWGYAAGLLLTYIANFTMHLAQPALLYIVPCVLVAVVWRAKAAGADTWKRVWDGPL